MTSRAERQERCERQIRRRGCFHLEMAPEAGRLDSSVDFQAAFQQCFLPIVRASGRCGVFGPRARELFGADVGWRRGEGGGYWRTFTDSFASAQECWSPDDRVSLEVSILVPLRLDDAASSQTLGAVIRDCHDPNTASNPTAIVTTDAFEFARASSRKGDALWLAFRSCPTNLYLTIIGKPAVVREWFRFAIDNARSEVWSCT